MKKRDYLLEVLKKTEEYPFGLRNFLTSADLLSLGLTSQKYYLLLAPTLIAASLDSSQQQEQGAKAGRNSKRKKNKTQLSQIENDLQVEVEKIPLWKWAQKTKPEEVEKWQKIQELGFNNAYLQHKIENKTMVFYRHKDSGLLMYLNRSMVDPLLNYNRGAFNEDLFQAQFYEDIFEGQVTETDFSSQEGLLKRQRELLEKIQRKKLEAIKNEVIDYTSELLKATQMRRLAIILCFGGSFSIGIFEGGRCLSHKSDHKYVCRKKAGERQWTRDKQTGGSIKSMGSQIRRDQQKKHVINVEEILKEYREQLQNCEVILLQAPGLNRLFVINEDENLNGLQDRLRSVCVTAKKANFTEVQSLFEAISQVNVVRVKE